MSIKHVIVAAIATCVTLLAGCSSGPSTSDAREAVVSQYGLGCPRLSISDFEKVNGAAQGDTGYQVSVKYLLAVTAHQTETQDTYAAKLADIDQRLQRATAKADSLNHTVSAEQPDLFAGGHDVEKAAYPALFDQAQAADSAVVRINGERNAALTEPFRSFVADCPDIKPDVLAVVINGAIQFEAANAGRSAYLGGYSVGVISTVNLIKTDKGWKAGL